MADAHPNSETTTHIERWVNHVAEVEGTVITHLVVEPQMCRALLAFHARRPLPLGKPLSIRATRRARGRMRAALRDA